MVNTVIIAFIIPGLRSYKKSYLSKFEGFGSQQLDAQRSIVY